MGSSFCICRSPKDPRSIPIVFLKYRKKILGIFYG